MEITIFKDKVKNLAGEEFYLYCGTIYETFKSSKDKKKVKYVTGGSKLEFAISLAWNILRNYKWLDTSSLLEVSKPKKYYNNKNKKSNKK